MIQIQFDSLNKRLILTLNLEYGGPKNLHPTKDVKLAFKAVYLFLKTDQYRLFCNFISFLLFLR